MARVEDGKPYGWGRLHAAFRVLEGLAGGTSRLAEPARRRETIDKPRVTVVRLLRDTSEHVLLAREKGGDHAKAAAQVYADIAELIAPERMYAKNPTKEEIAEFEQGYESQLARYRDRWGALVTD
ncbi:hypothetical protein ABZ990_17435 [Streptomyces sp. NPDC046203]|uniref:hypothetical protein n=1 Tax=Streptomyces sp. NPDC046203 TaxID=3154602 RepID=UPI0033FC6AD0